LARAYSVILNQLNSRLSAIWGLVGHCGGALPIGSVTQGLGVCLRTPNPEPDVVRCLWQDPQRKTEVVGDISLHERESLAEALGIRSSLVHVSDCELVVRAYYKWGLDFAAHLAGEFSFGLWDQANRCLVLVTDHFATRPLFFLQQGDFLAFASDPLLLLKVTNLPRKLNRQKLANMYLLSGLDLDPEETLFLGVRSLPPATCLSFRGNSFQLTTFWEPGFKPNVVPKQEDEAFEALKGLLFKSVGNRISGAARVTSMLSGGLDSSAMTAIAARCLEKENRSLLALAGVLPETQRAHLQDERVFIDEFRGWPNIRIEYVDAESGGPFDGIHDSERFAQSFLRTSRFYLYDAFGNAAAANQTDILIDGLHGEKGPTNRGDRYYLELAANFKWPTLLSELMNRPQDCPPLSRVSPFRTLAREYREFLVAPRRLPDPIVLLAASFLREYDAKRIRVLPSTNHFQYHLENVRVSMRKHAIKTSLWNLAQVRVSCPMLDRDIIEFCLAAPGRMKTRGGYSRYMIRRALDGVLPKAIQWRRDKKPFSPDYFVRYNAQLPKARDYVDSIRKQDPVRAVVDVAEISRRLQPVDAAIGSSEALTRIPLSIYLIAFLRQFPDFS
jgi:asparagine synthase (glutamine-hydrolysing)